MEETTHLYYTKDVLKETGSIIFYLQHVLIHLKCQPLFLTISSQTLFPDLKKDEIAILPLISQ